jgi:hypothetical protein
MRTAAVVVLVVAALAACAVVPSARADGDPASDYLLTQQVFLPFDAKFPADKQQQLTAVVTAANRAGYKIRVAVIWSSYDLGAITGLWRKPRTYARFLSAELEFVYKQRLLVVMPNGFGFNRPKHTAGAEYALLAKIPVRPDAAGLLDAAGTAVKRLAAASGVKVVPVAVASPSQRNSHDRAIIILGAIAAIAIATLLRLGLRRPRRR